MHDVLPILFAALLGAAAFLLVWIGERARASFLPPDSPWQIRRPLPKGGWLTLAALEAVVFASVPFDRLHADLSLQLSFVVWALGGSCLAVGAPWLLWGTRWLRVQQGRPLNAFGRWVMLLLLESLAATICTEDLRNWFPHSPAAHALQSAGTIASTVLLIVFTALMPLGMLDLISRPVLRVTGTATGIGSTFGSGATDAPEDRDHELDAR